MWLNDNSRFVPVIDPNMTERRTVPGIADIPVRIENFESIEQTYTPEQAQCESSRCLKCPTHWCQQQCPAGVPVTDFIALARAGRLEDAYQLIRSASTLPEICSRVCPQELQCQSNCTRGIRNQAVGIGRLERYVVEQHYASGNGEVLAAPTGKRVAIVGSGPAGLSAAQRLTERGHSVTVFEKASQPGGLLMYGIPNMKLDKGIVQRKVSSLETQGVVFYTNYEINSDTASELLDGRFDAVILAVGTGNARNLKLEHGSNASGIVSAVEFLSAATHSVLHGEKPISAKGKHVVVVGGGDTGNDCVGTALREGAISIVQLEMMPKNTRRQFVFEPHPPRAREKMHDFSQEECAARFGDPHRYQTTVKSVQTNAQGQVQCVTLRALKACYDTHFHLAMEEIPGSDETIPCEPLVVATGFIGPDTKLAEIFGAQTDERTNIATTSYVVRNNIFACGDCRTGQSLVVKAMTDGRNCADQVDAFLCHGV